MSEWKEYKFSQLCDISRGASPRPIQKYLTKNEGMPWVKIADATSNSSKYITHTNENIKLDGVDKSVKVYKGDLILSNSATPGLPKIMGIDACIHDGWMLLRNFKNITKEFTYWLLLNERKKLVHQGNGSVFINLKTDILKSHIVKIPDIKTQNKIVLILDQISNKIELNTQTNQTLEQIAQAIFKHWFINFAPVHAKANALARGETIEQAELAAMACLSGKTAEKITALKAQDPTAYQQLQQTAQAFPSEFVESEMGLVPRGWEVKPLIDQFDFLGGSQPPKSEHIYEEKEGYIRFIQNRDYANENHKTYIPISKKNKICNETDILMDKYGEAGKVRFGISGAYNVALAKIEPKNILFKEYLRWYFMQEKTQEFLFSSSLASTRSSLNSKTFIGMNILVPTNNVLSAFNVIAEKYIQHSLNLKQENRTLSEVRDLLLTKLICGEIDV